MSRAIRPGTKTYPVGRLTADALAAINTIGTTKTNISDICGWRRVQHFSHLIYREFPTTPRTIARLTKLGEVLGIDRVYEVVR